MNTNMLVRFALAVSVIFGLVGCSTLTPQVSEGGDKLVFVTQVHGSDATRSGASGAIGGQVGGYIGGASGSVMGGVLEAVASSLLRSLREPRVTVVYQDFDPRQPGAPKFYAGRSKTLEKPVWDGFSGLRPGTWAVLSTDDKGDAIVVPCQSECKPKS